MLNRSWTLALPLGLLFLPIDASGHPHAWIDLRSRVLLDDQGRIEALELDWLFDDFYTTFIAGEFVEAGKSSEEFLRDLARENLANLTEYDYFTDVKVDGVKIALGDVTRYEMGLLDNRLWLRFELPLGAPVDPKRHRVSFAVYDPTYYIEILNMEGEPITFSGPDADGCLGRIIPANPTPEAMSLAYALDQTETAGDGLGELFAETIEIECS